MTFIKPVFWDKYTRDDINSASYDPEYNCWFETMHACEKAYNYLVTNGASPPEARSVLPNSLKTEIVCTANIREWRYILQLRTALSAHPQMRALMIPLLVELKEKLPVLFEDIDSE